MAKCRVAAVMKVRALAWLHGAALLGPGHENDALGESAHSWRILDEQRKANSIIHLVGYDAIILPTHPDR